MQPRLFLIRLAPVLMIVVAAGFWISDAQRGGPYVVRNLIPLAVLVLLSALTLHRGNGTWTGSGWRMPLGVVGFAIPALGLSAYLHYAWSVNLNGMFTDAAYPDGLFRFLPVYTLVAGGIGFVIGWIVGKNV